MQVSIIATVAIYLGEVDDGISLMWKGLTQQETNVATVLPHYPFLGLPDDHPERAKLLAAIGWNVP